MKRVLAVIVTAFGLCAGPAVSSAGPAVSVFACEPEWASLAEEIGGERVKAFSATHAMQDPHYIRARPGLIAKMRRADMLFCSGAGLEAGWLPVLLEKAANASVAPGTPGYVIAADHVQVIENDLPVDRAHGDVHPEGNPHLHLDPGNIALLAAVVTERLSAVDAEGAGHYGARYRDFSARWAAFTARLRERAQALKGNRYVTHHDAWPYLLRFIGAEQAGSIEPKPGIPPTAGHLARLASQLRARPADAILRTPFAPEKGGDVIASRAGIPVITLPYTVGGKGADDLFSLFDVTFALLEAAR